MSTQPLDPRRGSGGRAVRWTAAIVLVLIALTAALSGRVQRCEESALVVREELRVVETCQDAPLADARYLSWLLVVAALLAPDISEFSVGSFSLKRRLDDAERRQSEIKSEVAALQQLVQMQAHQTMVIRNEPTYVNPSDPAVKAELHMAGVSAPVEPTKEVSYEEKALELLSLHERVSVFDVRYARVPATVALFRSESREAFVGDEWFGRVAQLWPEASGLGLAMLAEQAHVFTHNFPGLLDNVRAVRNAIAHGKPVEDDDLSAALVMARGLEEFILARFEYWRSTGDNAIDIGPRLRRQYPST